MTKLVDILAKNLNEWPDNIMILVQNDDGMIYGCRYDNNVINLLGQWQRPGGWGMPYYAHSNKELVAEDYQSAIITKEMWEEARMKLEEGHDWKVGEGLPPVGSTVQFYSDDFENEGYWHSELTNGVEVRIIAHFKSAGGCGDIAAFTFTYGPNSRDIQVEQAVACCFHPMQTAEQIQAELAAKEREECIAEMLRIFATGVYEGGAPAGCAALYDAGYRKVEGV
jgi:hypothetical protein